MKRTHMHPKPDTGLTFVAPSSEELSRLVSDAKQMQAEVTRDLIVAGWRRLANGADGAMRALGRHRHNLRGHLQQSRAERRTQVRVRRELMVYSDHELDELGIKRRDIPDIARAA